MRILVDCIPFDRGRSGISVYMRQVVGELARAGHELTLLVEPDAVDEPAFAGLPQIVAPRWTKRAGLNMMWHLFVLPFRVPFRNYDMVLLCAANRRAFCRYPVFTVAVVHDLSQYHVPTKYDRFRMFYIKHLLPHFVRKAQAVAAISRSTAADLERFWKIPRERIHVIYNGLSVAEGSGDAEVSSWLAEHGVERPYILYISRLEHPGKNHVKLIEAYGMLPEKLAERFDLVLPGAEWSGSEAVFAAAAKSPYAEHIRLTGFVDSALLPGLYRHAACYVFPSFFEGFGLSLIEAMHYGVPCACSNVSSLGEIGEGAALLFDPEQPAEIAAALEKLLDSEATREELRAAGLRRAAEFSWEKTAAELAALAARPRIFGVPCDTVTMAAALEKLDSLVRRRGAFAAFVNAHCLNVACKDSEYRQVLEEADAVWPDGSGVRIAGRILGFQVPANVNGTDMFPLICAKPYRIFMLGAAPGVAETAMKKAAAEFPNAKFVGAYPGFFVDGAEEKEVIARINALDPDILFVAMGVPRQEKWIHRHLSELKCGVAVAVGGLFDFVSGRIPRAPMWMRKCGIEWCYRLYREPLRLFRRYVIGNPLFILRLRFKRR